jgi:hypothetical protein
LRKIIAILAVALSLGISFVAAGSARADTPQGCDDLTAIGIEQPGYVASTNQLVFGGGEAVYFCNISIPINGQFEIMDEPGKGCLAINTTDLDISEDPASACALNNGAGYPWDRWTAISIEYHGNQLWMLKSADNGECIDETGDVDPAFYASCDTSNHYEWYSWPNSGL